VLNSEENFSTSQNTKYLVPKFFTFIFSKVEKIFSPKFAFVTLQQTSDIWIRCGEMSRAPLVPFHHNAELCEGAILLKKA
jgi:hypothetical protein